jgi:hypothetical protein
MRALRSGLAVVFLAICAGPAHAVVVSDCCDWASGWTFSSYTAAGAGTATATVEGSAGNPAARLNVTTVTPTPADTAYGTALLTTVSTAAPASGASFTLNIDALSGAGGFGQGQGILLLVAQGGSVYALPLGITGWPLNSFTTLAFSGSFTAASFTRISGAGPATPSFDGVTPTTYGFAAGNNMSATLTQYYDNFRLTIPSIGGGGGGVAGVTAAVPTLSELALVLLTLLLGGAAAVAVRRR